MFVRDQMTPHPVTITPESSITAAQRVMKENNVRHLPVISPGGALIGLLTRTTLEQVLPSRLTTLSVYELHYQLEKVTVRDAMLRQVITTTEDVPIEQAARLMWEKKIGCLPVMRGNKLVGIVTDIDLMRTMFELLGARQPGIRLALLIPGDPGALAQLTSAVAAEAGDITALGVVPSDEPLRWRAVMKVRFVEQARLEAAVKGIAGVELVDARAE
jgi:acetoin utilization protein AcuB